MKATQSALKLTEHRGPFCVTFLRRDVDRGPFHALKHTYTHYRLDKGVQMLSRALNTSTLLCRCITNRHVHMEPTSQTTCEQNVTELRRGPGRKQ